MDNQFIPFDLKAHYDVTWRNLPHRTQPGCTYFVTFHTADSIPARKRMLLRHEKARLLERCRDRQPASVLGRQFFLYQDLLEGLLDEGHGRCPFYNPAARSIVQKCFNFYDGDRYVLDRYVVMPNHVHTLLKPLKSYTLSGILHGWKSYTSSRVNRLTGETGRLWFAEGFDHIVRKRSDLDRFRSYIDENPRKAGLGTGKYLRGQGSGLVT